MYDNDSSNLGKLPKTDSSYVWVHGLKLRSAVLFDRTYYQTDQWVSMEREIRNLMPAYKQQLPCICLKSKFTRNEKQNNNNYYYLTVIISQIIGNFKSVIQALIYAILYTKPCCKE